MRQPAFDATGVVSLSYARFGWTSQNWAGYAVAGRSGHFRSIAGSWTVPAVVPSQNPTFSSTWIGVDGFQNRSLLQAGTEQDYYSGTSLYYAWWEILPHSEQRIRAFRVDPGDVIFAKISKVSKLRWAIALRNITTGRAFRTLEQYTGPHDSAEWIVEAPTANGKIAQIANFGHVKFEHCTVNSELPGFTLTDAGILVANERPIVVPSHPNDRGDGFQVRCNEGGIP